MSNQSVIAVLGMHRSGTSAVARGLLALGVVLGERLMKPSADNPRGYWEDEEIVSLNDRLLAELGMGWHSLRLIDPSQWETERVLSLKLEAVELVRARFGSYPLWGFKDPRTARLLPFWKNVFTHLGMRDSYVIVVRNPIGVARSLAARNGFAPEKSHLLWLEHYLSALWETQGRPWIAVDYDELIADPVAQLRRIAGKLAVPVDASVQEALRVYARDFISPELRHAVFSRDDVKLDFAISTLAKKVYDLFHRLGDNGTSMHHSVIKDLEAMRRDLAALGPLYRYLDDQEMRIRKLGAQVKIGETRSASLEAAVNERDGRIGNLGEELRAKERQIAGLEAGVNERDGRIGNLGGELRAKERQIAGLEAEVNERDGRIGNLGGELREKELVIGSLDSAIREKDLEISRDRNTIEKFEHTIRRIEASASQKTVEMAGLKAIESSLAWRAVKRFLDLVDNWLFPQDTKRGRLYLNVLRRIQARPSYDPKGRPLISPLENTGKGTCAESVMMHCDNAVISLDTIEASGWAIAPHGIERVEVYCDGTLVGHASYGHPRPDVQAVYPSIADSDRSGFSFLGILEKVQGLKDSYGLVIRAVDRNGGRAERALSIPYEEPYSPYLRKTMPSEGTLLWMREVSNNFSLKPLISLVLSATEDTVRSLNRSLESIKAQTYPSLEVILLCGEGHIRSIGDEHAAFVDEGRLKIYPLNDRDRALSEAEGEFIGFLRSGDMLSPHALFEMVKRINMEQAVDLLYSDEDSLSEGQRRDFLFKPDWSPDLLLSMNYIGHFFLARKKLFAEAGGLPYGLTSEGIYDLLLRVTERTGKVAHVPQLLYTKGGKEEYSPQDCKNVLEQVLLRRGIQGEVIPQKEGRYRIKRSIAGNPKVSIIILTACKNPDFLRDCLKSVVGKSTYDNYEIVIVDHTYGRLPREWIEGLVPASRLQVIKYNENFNFSRMNNMAAGKATGEYFLFLNDDTEVISPGWIEALLEHAQRPEVGVAGAKLLYPDDTIQHAGMLLVDSGGGARHAFRFAPENAEGYMGLLKVTRNCSGVTFACVMVSRGVFSRLKGLDENLKVECNDLDFCLRAIDAGYLIVWSPYAVLYHRELATRAAAHFTDDIDYLWNRWRHLLEKGDPYYNPNLTLDSDNFSLNMRPVLIEHHEPYVAKGVDGPRSDDMSIIPESIRRILVVKLDHIGDVILSLPAVALLRKKFPHARITMLVGSWARIIVERVKEVDDILTFDFFFERSDKGERAVSKKEMRSLEKTLKLRNFDLAIDLRRHPETRDILKLSGARHTAGFSAGSADRWLSICLDPSPEARDIPSQTDKPHIAAQMCELIQAIPSGNGVTDEAGLISPVTLSLNGRDALSEEYAEVTRAGFLVGIHPGVGSEIRQWPARHFARLIDLLIEQNNASVVIFGVKSEEKIYSQIYEQVRSKGRVVSLAGKISLEDFVSVVRYCDLFIGNVSGPCHIAAATGVPTLTIFGSQVLPHEWQPLGRRTMSVRVDILCSPCYKALPEQCQYDRKCLRVLWPEKVLGAAHQLLTISGNPVQFPLPKE